MSIQVFDKDLKYHQRLSSLSAENFRTVPDVRRRCRGFFGPNIEKSVFCYEQTTSIVNHRENISFSYIQSAGKLTSNVYTATD